MLVEKGFCVRGEERGFAFWRAVRLKATMLSNVNCKHDCAMKSIFFAVGLGRPALSRGAGWLAAVLLAGGVAGCQHGGTAAAQKPAPAPQTSGPVRTNKPVRLAKRLTYTPKVYPVDERGFSPVDKALAKAYAREELITDDAEGALNPYVLKVISAYPTDGSYPYHCSWTPREYDIYNGVTQDLWYKGMVVAKAYPDGSRCSYCCGFTFEAFVRAMKLRNVQKGLEMDDFNGMSFNDLFNLLQIWYIEGSGDCERRGIVGYGLGKAIPNLEDARAGDFLSYSTKPAGGHSVIFVDWLRDSENKIVGMKYFSSNLSGNSIGYGSGHFSDSTQSGRGILRNSLRIARVGAIKDYKAFNRAELPQRNAYLPTQPERIMYVPAPAAAAP